MDRPGSIAAATRPGHLAQGNAHAGAAIGSIGHDRGAPLAGIHKHATSLRHLASGASLAARVTGGTDHPRR